MSVSTDPDCPITPVPRHVRYALGRVGAKGASLLRDSPAPPEGHPTGAEVAQ